VADPPDLRLFFFVGFGGHLDELPSRFRRSPRRTGTRPSPSLRPGSL
jgi:hypothetical protein